MISKFILTALISIASAPALAGGQCVGKAAAHSGFCGDKGKQECKVHSGVCEWQKSGEKPVRVVASEKCVSQAGKEAHENFCNDHDKQVCAVHSSLCVWK